MGMLDTLRPLAEGRATFRGWRKPRSVGLLLLASPRQGRQRHGSAEAGRDQRARARPRPVAPPPRGLPRHGEGDSRYLSGAAGLRYGGRRGLFSAAVKRGRAATPTSAGASGRASPPRGRQPGPAPGRRLSHGNRAAKADRGPREGEARRGRRALGDAAAPDTWPQGDPREIGALCAISAPVYPCLSFVP